MSRQVKVDPRVLEDIAKLPENDQKAFMRIIDAFKQAAAMTPDGTSIEEFEANLKKCMPEAELGEIDPEELPEGVRQTIEARFKDEPEVH